MAETDGYEADPGSSRWLRVAAWLSIPVMAASLGMAIISINDVSREGASRPTGPVASPGGRQAMPRDAAKPRAAEPPRAEDVAGLSALDMARMRADAAADEARRQALAEADVAAAGAEAAPAPSDPPPALPPVAVAGSPPVPGPPVSVPSVPAAPGSSRDLASATPVPGPPAPVMLALLPAPSVQPPETPPRAASRPPAAAPPRPDARAEAPRPPRTDPRCGALMARFQLGERPSDAERRLLQSVCVASP